MPELAGRGVALSFFAADSAFPNTAGKRATFHPSGGTLGCLKPFHLRSLSEAPNLLLDEEDRDTSIRNSNKL